MTCVATEGVNVYIPACSVEGVTVYFCCYFFYQALTLGQGSCAGRGKSRIICLISASAICSICTVAVDVENRFISNISTMKTLNIGVPSNQQCPECVDEATNDQAPSSQPVEDQYKYLFKELEAFTYEWTQNEKGALCTDHASTAKSSDVHIMNQVQSVVGNAGATVVEGHYLAAGSNSTARTRSDVREVVNSELISEFETYLTHYDHGKTNAEEPHHNVSAPSDASYAPLTCEEIIQAMDTLEALNPRHSQAIPLSGPVEQKQNISNKGGANDFTSVANKGVEEGRNHLSITNEKESDYQPCACYQPMEDACRAGPSTNSRDVYGTSRETNVENMSTETRGRKRRSYEPLKCNDIKDEKERKKVQNVFYARRYRCKKRAEADKILAEEALLIEKNKGLRLKATEIESEVKMLKKLMIELCRNSTSS